MSDSEDWRACSPLQHAHLEVIAPERATRCAGAHPKESAARALVDALKADWLWTIPLIALAGVATAAGIGYVTLNAVYDGQRQYVVAKDLAASMRACGAETSLGSFEDGLEPDGCCVVAKRVGEGTVVIELDADGMAKSITYRAYVGNMEEVDAAQVSASIQSMAQMVAEANPSICPTAEQLQIDAAHIAKGLATQKASSSRIQVGDTVCERIREFEDYKTYGWVVTRVKPLPEQLQPAAGDEKVSDTAGSEKGSEDKAGKAT